MKSNVRLSTQPYNSNTEQRRLAWPASQLSDGRLNRPVTVQARKASISCQAHFPQPYCVRYEDCGGYVMCCGCSLDMLLPVMVDLLCACVRWARRL